MNEFETESPAGKSSRAWSWLKHAFAVESRRSLKVTPRQEEIVEKVCQEIIRRKMVTPALITLETVRPLNVVASAAMHFFEPVCRSLFDSSGVRAFANFLEQRGAIDYLVERLEAGETSSSNEEGVDPRG